ncbi:MAG: SpoVG family protein [Pirellulaceae bacterium]|nr:SpoVG family protein [Pirellulaceae bacterium]
MEITEVRIKLMEKSDDRLQAFCSVTFDNSFVVRDLKIIDGTNGPFVAMPSRKLTSHCHQCGSKNHLKAAYCNQCGARQRDDRTVRDADGRAKLYADIAHPINSACREAIQTRVIAEFQTELERAKQPGYASRYDDDYDDDIDATTLLPPEAARPSAGPPHTQIQPAQLQVPAPHILPAPPPAPSPAAAGSLGGPHFLNSPVRENKETREPAKEGESKVKPQRGDFGAGIF